jgi:DNA adenine methylase
MSTSTELLFEDACPPLFRWPGGKRRLLPALRELLPSSFGDYYEPFFGGGALFFSLETSTAHLSDKNEALIEMYSVVRDHPTRVINALAALPASKDDYYVIRGQKPTGKIDRAARFIYLVTLSFNGLYRENRRGEFNTPFGGRKSSPCDPEAIYRVSTALQKVNLTTHDFETAVVGAVSGDLIYLDPPYTVAHGKNGFVHYNANLFSWADQERLARCAQTLSARGCHVLVSNADHESLRDLYRDFFVATLQRPSTMAAATEHRKAITECVFHNISGA